MNATEQYIHNVMRIIPARPADRQRIENDLRAHLEEAMASGKSPQAVLARMGTPLEVATEFMSQVSLVYASFWLRLAASLIDMLVIFASAAILAIVAIVFSGLVPQHPQGGDYAIGALVILLCLGCAVGALGIIVLYFPLLEGRFGQTLGKRLLRMRVLTTDGLPIGYKEAFLRRLSYYFEILPVDMLFIFFSDKRQRAFDTIARTVVVQE